jgi:hypothetical protein
MLSQTSENCSNQRASERARGGRINLQFAYLRTCHIVVVLRLICLQELPLVSATVSFSRRNQFHCGEGKFRADGKVDGNFLHGSLAFRRLAAVEAVEKKQSRGEI